MTSVVWERPEARNIKKLSKKWVVFMSRHSETFPCSHVGAGIHAMEILKINLKNNFCCYVLFSRVFISYGRQNKVIEP
jgi:hypothetical protein